MPSLALQACGKRPGRLERSREIQREVLTGGMRLSRLRLFRGCAGDQVAGSREGIRPDAARSRLAESSDEHSAGSRAPPENGTVTYSRECAMFACPVSKRRFCSLILRLGTECGRGHLLSRTQEISAVPFTPRVRLAHATLGKRISGSAMKVASGQSSATPTGRKMKKMGHCLQLYPGPTRSYRKRVWTTAERPQP